MPVFEVIGDSLVKRTFGSMNQRRNVRAMFWSYTVVQIAAEVALFPRSFEVETRDYSRPWISLWSGPFLWTRSLGQCKVEEGRVVPVRGS